LSFGSGRAMEFADFYRSVGTVTLFSFMWMVSITFIGKRNDIMRMDIGFINSSQSSVI